MSDDGGDDAPSVAAGDGITFKDIDRPGANTGPKGVLADYADAKHKMELLNAQQTEAAWKNVYSNSMHAATVEEQQEMARQAQEAKDALLSSDEVTDDEDDEFMREYRQRRLVELKQEQLQRMRDAHRPTFGTLLTIAPEQLVECVDNEHPDTFVIVHLFEAHLPQCTQLNTILQSLARKLPLNKFVKMTASEASSTLTPETLPTVVVYKGGEQIKTWIRLGDALRPMNDDTVSMWLLKEDCLTLDDEQRERLASLIEGGTFDFDRTVQMVDPKLLLQLTQLLR